MKMSAYFGKEKLKLRMENEGEVIKQSKNTAGTLARISVGCGSWAKEFAASEGRIEKCPSLNPHLYELLIT